MRSKTEGDAREFGDPEGFGPDAVELLEGQLERAAVALWLCSFHTPEDAGQLLGRKSKAWELWAKPSEDDLRRAGAPHPDGDEAAVQERAADWKAKDRHLYRRRAYLALNGKL